MRTWKSVELFNAAKKEALLVFLKEKGIQAEVSGCWNGWHFEVYVDDTETDIINEFLGRL